VEKEFLPDADAAKTVSVSRGDAGAGVTVLTQAIAVKETGLRQTVKRFGEVYASSPTFFAVHRDQPTQISFRNRNPTTSTTSCSPIRAATC
jgi:tRNA A37 threonylcarbamoyladenosine biosynthesis protein TsaE